MHDVRFMTNIKINVFRTEIKLKNNSDYKKSVQKNFLKTKPILFKKSVGGGSGYLNGWDSILLSLFQDRQK